MSADPRAELLTLVADVAAAVDAWVAAGHEGLPRGEVAGLGPPPVGEVLPVPPSRPAERPAPRPAAVPPPAPRPAPPVAAPAPRAPPAPPVATPARPPVSPAPPAAASPALFGAAPPPAPAGLFGGPPAAEAPGPGLFGAKWSAYREDPAVAQERLLAEARGCERCGRCTTRKQVVPGGGAARAPLLVLTPPPDRAEEAAGTVLVGEPGAMFDRMAVNVLALERADVHLAPVLLCAGGTPTSEELAACRTWLERRVEQVKPRAILVLGEEAGAALGLRLPPGRWQPLLGTEALVSAHPAQLLAEPARKRDVFEHLKELRRRVG